MPNLLIADFETYYDQEYSLKRMTPAEYILDPRFEVSMVAVKAVLMNGTVIPHQIIEGPAFPQWLAQFDPAETTTVTYNALFDNCILAWIYGFVPHTMIDAMAMVRTLDGHKLSRFNLANVSDYLGIAAKQHAINDVIGIRYAQLRANAQLWSSFSQYALQDNINCEAIFKHYYPRMPWSERRLMDMVLRCCVEPRFNVDTVLLDQHIKDVVAAKDALLVAAGNVDKTMVMSTPKFKEALEKLGVVIEYKPSPSVPGKELPCFSKTDEFMEILQNSPDINVAALATARVGLKSTLEETRAGTLMRIGKLPWSILNGQPRIYSGGNMPVPLRYGGAHTHRLSGDWKMNMQNMPTVRGSKGKSKLRLSLKAPPGHKVVTIDLGQIEARLVAWLCNELVLLNEFAQKLDPYNQLATAIFGRPVNRRLVGTIDENMGFIGKTGILGLGYGAGKDKFDGMVIMSARSQGADISQIYNRAIGDKAVDTYRSRYKNIPMGWGNLNAILQNFFSSNAMRPTLKWGGPQHNAVEFRMEQDGVFIRLPSGLDLSYASPRMQQVLDKKTGRIRPELSYLYGNKVHRIYGAKCLENISQALARIIVMNAALRIRDRGKHSSCPWAYRFVHQAHDELVYILPDSELALAKGIIHQEMVRRPSWGRDIPLVADVGEGDSYGEAK